MPANTGIISNSSNGALLTGVTMNSSWKASLAGAMIALVLAGLVMWPTAIDLAASWERSEAYHYAWLVLPMFVYLVASHHRDEILALHPTPDARGVALAILAAVGWSVASAANIDIARQFTLILVIQGIALSALGLRLYWRLFPIFGLLFLMLPSADLLLLPLRLLTVKAIELFALLANLPHRIDGFNVVIGDHAYFVLDACAGLSHVTLTFFLGYCFGVLIYRSIYRIVALALLGAFFGVLSNVLRVNAIVWLDQVQGAQMDLTAHARIQWVALLLVLAVLFHVLTRLAAETAQDQSPSTPSALPSRLGVYAPVVAGLAVAAITGLATLLPGDEARTPRAASVTVPPDEILGWKRASPVATWRPGPLRHLETLTLDYRRNGQDLRVTVIETLSPAAKLPESQLAPHDPAFWRDARRETLRSCVAAKCLGFVHTTWERDPGPAVLHVYYSYAIGDFHTDSKLGLRLASAWYRLSGRRDTPRLIGFSVDGGALPPAELVVVHNTIEAALGRGRPAVFR